MSYFHSVDQFLAGSKAVARRNYDFQINVFFELSAERFQMTFHAAGMWRIKLPEVEHARLVCSDEPWVRRGFRSLCAG